MAADPAQDFDVVVVPDQYMTHSCSNYVNDGTNDNVILYNVMTLYIYIYISYIYHISYIYIYRERDIYRQIETETCVYYIGRPSSPGTTSSC